MKKLLALLTVLVLFLAACGNNDEAAPAEETPETNETTTLKVASLIPPMTEILDLVKPMLAENYCIVTNITKEGGLCMYSSLARVALFFTLLQSRHFHSRAHRLTARSLPAHTIPSINSSPAQRGCLRLARAPTRLASRACLRSFNTARSTGSTPEKAEHNRVSFHYLRF